MNTDKRYRLLKDLPEAKAGDIYFLENNNGDTYVNEYTLIQKSPVIEHNSYFSWQVENNPEWFELITEQPKEDKIKIEIEKPHPDSKLILLSASTAIPEDKLPLIKQAIESVLNNDAIGYWKTIDQINQPIKEDETEVKNKENFLNWLKNQQQREDKSNDKYILPPKEDKPKDNKPLFTIEQADLLLEFLVENGWFKNHTSKLIYDGWKFKKQKLNIK